MTHSKQTRKNNNKILLIIFLATVIPTIIVYVEHAIVEYKAYKDAKTETKQIKTLSEAGLFYSIAMGYTITTLFIIIIPKYRIPYIVIIVGTIAVIILWLVRIYGIPIPGTQIVIVDFSTDWRDVITKTCQTIMLPVVTAAMLVLRKQ